jgi:hypothetical protein
METINQQNKNYTQVLHTLKIENIHDNQLLTLKILELALALYKLAPN